MKAAICVDNVSKQFRLGVRQSEDYRTLRESIVQAVTSPLRRLRGGNTDEIRKSLFWALSGVSFEVHQGEAIGIVGRNGAGKSTLLKILSRVLEPTSGRATFRGRMGSLLEVGTGFHPEMTGRENIYLNGVVLGMSRAEVKRKFDEIVAFAEIEKFLETPVKRYSSGMYIRLAFAVAAHLEPEILIVDEVLAVGDASFQQKCLGKMRDVSRTGRTVLFVSHNMQAVTMLCTRALLLNQGQVVLDDKPLRIVESYLHAGNDRGAEASWDVQKAPGNDLVRLTRVHVVDDAGRVRFDNDITKPINVAMEFSVLKAGAIISPSFHVHNGQGACLFAVGVHLDKHRAGLETPPGKYRVTCRIPAHFFNDGKHYVSAFLVRNNNDVVVNEPEVLSFMTHDYGEFRGGYTGKIIGAIRPFFPWDVERIGELS